MELNGNKKPPTITLSWDETNQGVEITFDPADFKNWDFVAAILKMGEEHAKFTANVMKMQAMQRQAMEAAQGQAIAQQVIRNPFGARGR